MPLVGGGSTVAARFADLDSHRSRTKRNRLSTHHSHLSRMHGILFIMGGHAGPVSHGSIHDAIDTLVLLGERIMRESRSRTGTGRITSFYFYCL